MYHDTSKCVIVDVYIWDRTYSFQIYNIYLFLFIVLKYILHLFVHWCGQGGKMPSLALRIRLIACLIWFTSIGTGKERLCCSLFMRSLCSFDVLGSTPLMHMRRAGSWIQLFHRARGVTALPIASWCSLDRFLITVLIASATSILTAAYGAISRHRSGSMKEAVGWWSAAISCKNRYHTGTSIVPRAAYLYQ